MKEVPKTSVEAALAWCEAVLGPVQVLSDHSKVHGGHESATRRLHTSRGYAYLKIHQAQLSWNNEVHAYERWSHAFGNAAPSLLAVCAEEPLALVISELPGQIVEDTPFTRQQEWAIWRAAGAALRSLHQMETGTGFGPCRRDGTCVESNSLNASDYVAQKLDNAIEQADRLGYVSTDELATLHAARLLIPAFDGEPPIPCHRDYCAANWLFTAPGTWAGVIDFEFAYWDVRVADFSRDPNWSWVDRPDRWEAFFDGYGRSLTSRESQQLLVAHAEYAIGAILWGHAHEFYGFEREGRAALAHLRAFVR